MNIRVWSVAAMVMVHYSIVWGQCPTTTISGNLVPSLGDTLSGTYLVSGNFVVSPGVTVHVRPFRSGGCGELRIIATGNVQIDGSIQADGAGYAGGVGGFQGAANNISFIESCPAPTDQCGAVVTFGGGAGSSGNPGGGGISGSQGLDGSGRKNQCFTFNDDGGRIGGSGGGGGAGGGSYGGLANGGAPGGAGSLPVVNSAISTCTTNVIGSGFGGNGGSAGSVFGTLAGLDIDKGSAGGGAGGGGRGRQVGNAGGIGGSGGGLVYIESSGNFSFTGSISADGTAGATGGNGGAAGPSPRCCSDGCDGVDEYTHTGAGGGGGGAGGGSGGGVLFKCGGIATITGNISVTGGNGGMGGQGGAAGPNLSLGGGLFCSTTTANTPAGNGAGQGGAGGGGRIKVFFNDCAPGNLVVPATDILGGTGNGGAASSGTFYAGPDVPFTAGALSPSTQTVCYLGDPGNLNSLPATGGFGSISYQWQASLGCTGTFSNIPGANSLNYDPPSGITSTTCYRVQVLSGTCVAYADTLVVNVIPPQSASISPTGNVLSCVGDSVLLQTSGGPGAAYQWLFNGIAIPSALDSFLVVNSSGAYSVQIFYPVGCAGLSPQTSVSFSLPPSAFAFSGGDTVLCPGEQVTLTAFGTGSYQWQFNGIDVPGATSSSFLASQPGLYQVAVTSSGGCTTQSDTLQLVGSSFPTATLSNLGPLTFCAGDSVVLLSSGGNTIEWLQNGLPLSGQPDSVLTVWGSGQYAAVVESGLGCRDTTLHLTVFSDTVVAGLVAAVSPIACLGDSALYLASGGGSYQWLFNQQPIADTTNFLFAGTQGDYTVVVTSAFGCVDTSSTLAFSYFPPIFPSVQLLGSPFICPGDTIMLNGSAPGSTGVQWLLNDLPLSGATGINHMATSSGVYTLQAQDIFGCEYVSSYTPVFPGAEPVAEILLSGPAVICRGDSLVLTGLGGDSLFWYRDGILIQADTSSAITVDSGGSYSLVVQTSCGSDTSATLAVDGNFGPTADFFANNLPDQEVEFVDQSLSGAVWWWSFGGGDTSILQNPIHVFPGPGAYEVTMITADIFGCRDTITRVVVVEDPILFIPNVFSPNGDGVNDVAQTNFNFLESLSFRIYDRWGKVVFETRSKSEYWDGRAGKGQAPDGVYFYQLVGTDVRGKKVQTKGNLTLLR